MRKWKIIFIFGVILFSIYSVIPSIRFYSMPAEKKAKLSYEQKDKYSQSIIKLGLDLQGGMHLVLEVDDSKLDQDAKKDALDRAIKIIRNRVDQFGVSEPVIQRQGERRIIVELPGLQDISRAKQLIGRTALLEFRLVKETQELARVLKGLDKALKGVNVQGSVVDSTRAQSLHGSARAEKEQVQGEEKTAETPPTPADSILETLPGEEVEVPSAAGVSEDRPFTSYIVAFHDGGVAVDERDMEKINLLLATPQAKSVIPSGMEFLWATNAKPLEGGGQGRVLYLVDKRPLVTGRSLVNAYTQPDPDNPANLNVAFTLNKEGAIKFARFTGENIGKRLAIILDSKVRSAPVVQSKIPGGKGRITGRFSNQEASDLAIVLRAGALPAPVEIKEERSIGPTLGRDSIVLGVKAAIYGFIVVMLFMVFYYRASGVLACAALVLNLVIVLAVLARLHAALTLPGIAGLILTIGMAVDANVLIFERIREELAKAKTVRSAIDSGYDRAFTTIFDANLTTLITAFVLWQFGTGPIKGFATTLSIGIIASMFTALMCTKAVYDFITSRKVLKKLSI
jgi:protein-export membrane protein SecD